MKQERQSNTLVVLMVLIAVWALALGGHTYLFAISLTVVLLAHLIFQIRLPGRPTVLTGVLLVVPFAFWFRTLSHNPTISGFTQVDLLFLSGFYALALGTHHLLCSRTGGSVAYAFAAAIIAMTLAGVAMRHKPFLPMVILFMPMVLMEMRRELGLLKAPSARGLWFQYGTAIALWLTITLAIQFLVMVEVPAFNQWLSHKVFESINNQSPGISKIVRLGSISEKWGNNDTDRQIVLRQWSQHPTTHLRALVFDEYGAGSWRDKSDQDQYPAIQHPRRSRSESKSSSTRPHAGALSSTTTAAPLPGSWRAVQNMRECLAFTEDNGRELFYLPPNGIRPSGSGGPSGTIYPATELGQEFFLPIGTKTISAFCDRVRVSNLLTAEAPEQRAAGGYCYFDVATDQSAPTDMDLQIPDELQEPLEKYARDNVGLTALANEALQENPAGGSAAKTDVAAKGNDATLGKLNGPEAVAAKLKDYFQQNFTYHLGIKITGTKDPVLEFLDKKRGHCEYFAAAGTLLLRSVGIPARYVTGYMCAEKSPDGAYLISRRRDAHAWVEIYVQNKGWVTFDPTPAADRPEPVVTSAMDRFFERFDSVWQRIWSVAAYGGILAILTILWGYITALFAAVPSVVWALIVILGSAWTFRKSLRSLFLGEREAPQSKRVRQLRAKLQRAEKILGRYGLIRPPTMTVGEFLRGTAAAAVPAALKQEALSLLQEYQSLRFCRQEEGTGKPTP